MSSSVCYVDVRREKRTGVSTLSALAGHANPSLSNLRIVAFVLGGLRSVQLCHRRRIGSTLRKELWYSWNANTLVLDRYSCNTRSRCEVLR